MSAVWFFFDLGEAMCQLCKAEVSGSVKSERVRMRSTSALENESILKSLSFVERMINK